MTDNRSETTPAEAEEQRTLADVQARLDRTIADLDRRLRDYADEVQRQKDYLWESRTDMDHAEKVANREAIERSSMTSEAVQQRRQRLARMRGSPYFGRIDFAPAGSEEAEPVYIGLHHFRDDRDKSDVVHDWRAPIASLFYDYETGPARYEAPDGAIGGTIHRKRQFRIKGGEMELMLESSVNVVDEVLQEELARASDEGMRNIVATIQRDQNAIIRNDQAQVLIIQGVAGSGKTSIALHRIAYLLYRYKDTLTSDDILIISPNRVFADYVANVLPELGEESVGEIGMEDLADELLEGQYRFQTFFEQTEELLERGDEAFRRRLAYKASPEFLDRLGEYAAEVEANRFRADDVWIAGRLLPGWVLEEIFRKHRSKETRERIRQVAVEAEKKIGLEYNYDLDAAERRQLKEAINGMVDRSTLRATYKAFFDWLGEPDLFRTTRNGRLEYADVFPLIYLKMRLEGIRSPYRRIKHLIIDEMQDYTPVQYAVLGRLFGCSMTILGDAQQSVNPYCSSAAREIQEAFWQAEQVTLNKSYRSSYEITQFAQGILPNPDLEAMERHGEAPEVIPCRTRKAENAAIREQVQAFTESEHNALSVICKTPKQAQRIHKTLTEAGFDAGLLTADSRTFTTGVVVCTAHMAKGLEFDRVVVPLATADNYHTDMDRHLLYVACTRAMHRLTLTHAGEPSPLLPDG